MNWKVTYWKRTGCKQGTGHNKGAKRKVSSPVVASVATVASVGPVGGSDVTPVTIGTVPVVGTHVSAVVPERAKTIRQSYLYIYSIQNIVQRSPMRPPTSVL